MKMAHTYYLIQYYKNHIFGIRKLILYILIFYLFCAIFLVTDYIPIYPLAHRAVRLVHKYNFYIQKTMKHWILQKFIYTSIFLPYMYINNALLTFTYTIFKVIHEPGFFFQKSFLLFERWWREDLKSMNSLCHKRGLLPKYLYTYTYACGYYWFLKVGSHQKLVFL